MTTLRQMDLDTFAQGLVKHRRCLKVLDAAFDRALINPRMGKDGEESFHIVLAASGGESFDLSYMYVAGNLLGASIHRLPQNWRVTLLKLGPTTFINVFTDPTMGCGFVFDLDDPSEATGMAKEGS